MDIVTKNLVSSFKSEESFLDDIDNAILFEHFANFCVVSKDYGEEFDVDDLHTGGGDDLGIDGFGILVNGTIVSDTSEVEDLAATNRYLETEFIFCQAKSGGNFTGSEISNFFFGVKDLFSQTPCFPVMIRLQKRRRSSKLFTREVPCSREATPSSGCIMSRPENGRVMRRLRRESKMRKRPFWS